ncbi:MAG: PIN domain-containing protein [Actinomycetota bacterium]|nr:PIN domain-containing protein [Actinomycetota bacterium]MDD5666446.1 PIN domain-containing protein [Actinomycetota bacterium]
MRCFVDTSAFIALLNRDDRFHGRAKARWQELLSDDVPLVTSNYVIMETFTLAMHRLGRRAAKDFNDAVVPVLETVWINEDIHGAAVSSIVVSGKRNLSLVDCSSFEIMRRLGVERAFAFERHFRDQGFSLVN